MRVAEATVEQDTARLVDAVLERAALSVETKETLIRAILDATEAPA